MEIQKQEPGRPLTVETAVCKSSSMALEKVFTKLMPEEQRILGMKYRSKRIKDLTPDELVLHTKGLCFKTCIITGWQMPDIQEYVNVFEDQLRKFLVDEYMNLNIDEFEYAMRVHGTKIIDWGKSLNLSLIRQALDTYVSQRAELSRLEEQKTIPEPQPETMSEPADWSDTWERLVKGEIKGQFYDLTPWSAIYDWLERAGKIKPKNTEKWNWLQEACVKEINNLAIKKEAFQATVEEKAMLVRLQVMKWEAGRFPDDKVALAHLISPSKRIAVQQLLTKISNNENTSGL